jgi:hypothetical protein
MALSEDERHQMDSQALSKQYRALLEKMDGINFRLQEIEAELERLTRVWQGFEAGGNNRELRRGIKKNI